MKGLAYESPRGPITLAAQTRDIAQDVYIHKVERRDGQLYYVEIDKVKSVKDSGT
jgi:branched-chain amino acid transport system substrate-binding protein